MMIEISDVTFSYEKEPLINQLNMNIAPGFNLLIGPTGCGKSTEL